MPITYEEIKERTLEHAEKWSYRTPMLLAFLNAIERKENNKK